METYNVTLTNTAVKDLDELYSYIAETLKEPETALKLIDTLEQKILSLSQLPYRCTERTAGLYANKGYRQLLVKNFTVVYRINEAKKQVIIVTVKYSKSQF